MEYPPIYVAGDVAAPGEYKYRPGMTVVQALALGGGIYRTGNRAKKDDIQVTGELRGYQIEMLGAQIRIARLEAELAGATSIAFPKPPVDADDAALVAQMRTQEELVFASRANELQRQTKSLDELRGLLQAEISTLQQKIDISEKSIATAEKELRGVEILVGKGIALASRQSDLERVVASYQSDRLDRATEMMRARQSITETTRSLEGLVDKRRTEVSIELQTERGRLDLLKVKMGVGREMLLDSMSTSDGTEPEVTFAILRVKGGSQKQFPATETTFVQPGDVVTASTSKRARGRAA